MFVNLKQAFSLVEVAIIMSLIAIFITNNHIIVAKLDAASKFENQIDELQNISNQIRAYYYSNKVLPCPAPLAKDIYDKKSLLAAKFNNECLNMFGVFESKNEEFYMGAVPTYDLNLPSQNLTDIWGSKYFYIVKKELVTNEKLLMMNVNLYSGKQFF